MFFKEYDSHLPDMSRIHRRIRQNRLYPETLDDTANDMKTNYLEAVEKFRSLKSTTGKY